MAMMLRARQSAQRALLRGSRRETYAVLMPSGTRRMVIMAAAVVVKFKIQVAVSKAKEWSLMRHV